MRAIALLCLALAGAVRAAPVAVPPELEPWRAWALAGAEQQRCPALVRGGDAREFRCAWPETLALRLDAHGGTFTQDWELYAEDWVPLPGSEENWPVDVRVDGAAGAPVLRGGEPMLRLAPGRHAVSGGFAWPQRPAQLAVPAEVGLLALSVDGVAVRAPARSGNQLELGVRAREAAADALQLRVYRLVEDEIPTRLATRLVLEVAGEVRELKLAGVLPAGYVPTSLDGTLPARLDADGALRLLLRPGLHELTLGARAAGVVARIARPASAAPWPEEEVWSFRGVDRLRVAAADGAPGIDAGQAQVPGDWRSYPAFRVMPGGALQLTERSRGLGAADENRLSLRRELWLDFDHRGYTAVDHITGTMRQGWRLDTAGPFRLASARLDEDNLLVTELAGATGVELRSPALDLEAASRSEGTRARMPASGWATRFEKVEGMLHLPPGHRLLAAPGSDDAPGSWWSQWTLWSLFGVLIVVVFTQRVAGPTAACVAALALALLYQESPQHIWLWANALLAIALARGTLPDRWRRALSRYRALSLAALGLALLPLLWGQLRLVIHPQLEAAGAPLAAMEAAHAVKLDMPMPAAAPPQETFAVPARRMLGKVASTSNRLEEIVVTGAELAPAVSRTDRYAPGTLLQAGPGIPDWSYNDYAYSWTGPVEAGETVRFIYIGPWLLGLWRMLGVAMTGLWFAWLLQEGIGAKLSLPRLPLPDRRAGTPAAMLLVALVAAALGGLAVPRSAAAASTPDPALLAELRTRLLAPPACSPNCLELDAAHVAAADDGIELTLSVAALADVALPLPDAGRAWQVESLSLDGHGTLAAQREGDSMLWVPLRAGAHQVRVVARAAAGTLSLNFPLPPRHASVAAGDWDVAGLNGTRLVAGSLQLARRRSAPGAAAGLEPAQFPAFVRVTRNVRLDLDWRIDTTVERLAPRNGAITAALALWPGESVLTPGLAVAGKPPSARVTVGIAAGAASTGYSSSLARADALELAASDDAARTEVWNFSVAPQWSLRFTGFPAVLPEPLDESSWVFQYLPRPGEHLSLAISRPAATAGETLAIDGVRRHSAYGARSVDESLEFDYRSTQGGRHAISLPAGARVQSVSVDGEAVALRPEDGELSLGLLPGAHSVSVQWQRPVGAGFAARAGAIDLHAEAGNVRTEIDLPRERWPLAASSSLAGPVVRYWSELLAFALAALLLGRIPASPLAAREWLLLGLGLSTQSWLVFALMGAWFFALRWRARWQPAQGLAAWRYNLVQLSLALLTAVALGSLLFSGVRYGFLSAPDMGVAGAGSWGNHFAWFHDRAHGALPATAVWSLPLWCYKLAMFAWALWIAFALSRWLRWAWDAWSAGGTHRAASAPPGAAPRA